MRNMSKKQEYKQENTAYLRQMAQKESIKPLGNGVLYEVLEQGNGSGSVRPSSIVTCYYKGSLINGTVFDDNWDAPYPEAFRVNELIDGFAKALISMHIGDHWRVYIPQEQGYGTRRNGDIPGNSTLIFEIKLLSVV